MPLTRRGRSSEPVLTPRPVSVTSHSAVQDAYTCASRSWVWRFGFDGHTSPLPRRRREVSAARVRAPPQLPFLDFTSPSMTRKGPYQVISQQGCRIRIAGPDGIPTRTAARPQGGGLRGAAPSRRGPRLAGAVPAGVAVATHSPLTQRGARATRRHASTGLIDHTGKNLPR